MEDGKLVAGTNGDKSVVQAEFRKAPLPKPQEMREYDEVRPGLSEIIIREFRKQGGHRRLMEKLIVIGQLYFGPILASTVLVVILVLGYKLIQNDKPTEGFVLILGSLSVIGGLFVWNKKKDESNTDENEEEN